MTKPKRKLQQLFSELEKAEAEYTSARRKLLKESSSRRLIQKVLETSPMAGLPGKLGDLQEKVGSEVLEQCLAAIDETDDFPSGWTATKEGRAIASRAKKVAKAIRDLPGLLARGTVKPHEQEAHLRRAIYGRREGARRGGRSAMGEELLRTEAEVIKLLTSADLGEEEAREYTAVLMIARDVAPRWRSEGARKYKYSGEGIRKRQERRRK